MRLKGKLYSLGLILCVQTVTAQLRLQNERLQLEWTKQPDGYQLATIRTDGQTLSNPSGKYLLLYSAGKPDSIPNLQLANTHPGGFSLADYRYLVKNWEDNLRPVNMNTAGIPETRNRG